MQKRTGNDFAPQPPKTIKKKTASLENSPSFILKKKGTTKEVSLTKDELLKRSKKNKKHHGKVTYYLDDVLINKNKMSKIATQTIKNINVEKSKGKKNSGKIYIYTKK